MQIKKPEPRIVAVYVDGVDCYGRYSNGEVLWLEPTEIEACMVACNQSEPIKMEMPNLLPSDPGYSFTPF